MYLSAGGRGRRTKCGREELPHVRGQGRRQGGATLLRRSGTAAKRSHPASEARGGDREEQPRIQGAVAVQAQEGLEEPSHIEGQEGQR